MGAATVKDLKFHRVDSEADFPPWANREQLVDFLHYKMKPYEDETADINRGLDYVFSDSPYAGGFVVLAQLEGRLVGACVMQKTGMKGYIPENVLLFVSIDPELRGRGLGRALIEKCLAECKGDVKLHVEYDNPAKRLYERIGFTSKYAEMRYERAKQAPK